MFDGPAPRGARSRARCGIVEGAKKPSHVHRYEKRSGPLGVAVVGIGGIARRFHLPALSDLAKTRVVAIADSDPEALRVGRSLAPDATAYSDWREALGQPDVHAVLVCLPTRMHASTAIECLRREKHLYLEKPIASTLKDAEEIAACAQGRHVIAQIGFNFRFHPMVAAARSMIARGELGRLLALKAVVANRSNLTGWRGSEGGGALLDLAVHHIDLARFILADEFADVSATAHTYECGRETVQLTASMEQGVLVDILASNAAKRLDQLVIVGESNSVYLDRFASTAHLMHRSRPGSWRQERVANAVRLALSAGKTLLSAAKRIPDPSFGLALEAFVDTTRHARRQSSPSLADGLEAMRVIAAAELALDKSRSVALRMDRETIGAC